MRDGQVKGVIALDCDDDQIVAIYSVLTPDNLPQAFTERAQRPIASQLMRVCLLGSMNTVKPVLV